MWKNIENRVDSRNMAFFGFWMAVIGLIGSLFLSWQDWTMSYYGFQWLEDAYGLKVTTEPWVLIPLAIIPWVAQIILFFLYGLDTSKKWPLVLAAVMFLFDLATDVQFRSNANLVYSPAYTVAPPTVGRWTTVGVSAGVTIIFFGIMAEVLFTASIALVTGLYEDAIEQWGTMRAAQIRAGNKTKGMIDAARKGGMGGGSNKPSSKPQNQQPRGGGGGRNMPPNNLPFTPPRNSPQPPRAGLVPPSILDEIMEELQG
jgi:hypothetical protein